MTGEGKSIHSMNCEYSQAEMREKLKTWLQAKIEHLETWDTSEGYAA
jgi:hypothetical protein